MNRKLSQHMSMLGFCAMLFYGAMLACGQLSLDVLPQFAVSAFIFLASGNLIRRTVRVKDEDEDENRAVRQKQQEQQDEKIEKVEPDWEYLANWLNWSMVVVVVVFMAAWIMTPIGITFTDIFHQTTAEVPYTLIHIP